MPFQPDGYFGSEKSLSARVTHLAQRPLGVRVLAAELSVPVGRWFCSEPTVGVGRGWLGFDWIFGCSVGIWLTSVGVRRGPRQNQITWRWVPPQGVNRRSALNMTVLCPGNSGK